jgi:hypothetical protein
VPTDPPTSPLSRRLRFAPWLVALIAVAAHLPDLFGSFMADDYPLLVGVTGEAGPSLGRALGYFVQPLPGIDPPLPPDFDPRFWRPLWMTSLGLDLVLFGPRPGAFLAVNVALHAACSVLLWAVASRLGAGRLGSLAAGGLFAAWPGHHEAVPWIAARCGPMALGFGLAALLALLVRNDLALERRRPRVALALAAAAATALALTSKESAFVLPPLLTLALLLRGKAAGVGISGLGARIRVAAGATWPSWLVFAGYLALRYRMLGHLGGGYRIVQFSPLDPRLWPQRLATLDTLLGPAKEQAFGGAVHRGLMLSTLVLLAVGVVAGFAQAPRLRPALGLAVGWLLLALAPIHNMAVFPDVQTDARFLYEPAAPLCLWLGLSLAGLGATLGGRRRPTAALRIAVALLILGSGGLYLGNLQARDRGAVISDALIAEAASAIASRPAGRYVFVDVPRRYYGVHVGINILPFALMPPFAEAAPDARMEVLFADQPDPAAMARLSGERRRGARIEAFAWDRTTGRFRHLRTR